MNSEIQKVAVYDDRIVQNAPAFAVQKGALSLTNSPFKAISATASQHTYNINVPSENVFVDRAINWTSTVYFEARLTFDAQPDVGHEIGRIGRDFALCSFPLHSLCNTLTATINDATTTVNLVDCLYEIARLTDFKANRGQRCCPTMLDKYQKYETGWGAINNVCSGYQDATDFDNVPNGAFADFEFVDPTNVNNAPPAGGDYTYKGLTMSFNADGVPIARAGQLEYILAFKFRSTEKIMLSPFIYNDEYENDTGLYGIQNIQFVMNIKSPARLLRVANNSEVNPNRSLTVSQAMYLTAEPFRNSTMNVEFLTPSLSLPLPEKSIVPYFDYPRYITTNLVAQPNATTELTSNTIILNSIPDLFLIYIKPDQYLNTEGDYYFTPKSISIQFDNFAGILSSHTQEQLYQMSHQNGLEMDYNTWRGRANTSNGVKDLVGGFLVLRPGKDIPLMEGQSPGLLGSFSFQCRVSVESNRAVATDCQMFVVAVNSGFFESQNGSSRIIKNPLSEADIINAPQSTMTTNANVSRMVGSGFFKSLGSKLTTLIKNNKPLISAMKHALKSGHLGETAEFVSDFIEKKGYGQTGGGQTGGSQTGGKKKKALLSRLM